MPIAAFPSKTAVRRAHERELEPEYVVTRSPRFGDGGHDFNLDADNPVRRWRIEYTGLTLAQVTALSDHAAAAKYNPEVGSAFGFEFTDRGGATVANVRYDQGGFRRTHTKYYGQGFSAEVQLVKYP